MHGSIYEIMHGSIYGQAEVPRAHGGAEVCILVHGPYARAPLRTYQLLTHISNLRELNHVDTCDVLAYGKLFVVEMYCRVLSGECPQVVPILCQRLAIFITHLVIALH